MVWNTHSLTCHYRQPFSFVTSEVVEATTQCLLAQAEETERGGQHSQVTKIDILLLLLYKLWA